MATLDNLFEKPSTSTDLLKGIKFMMDMGAPLDEKTLPNILEAMKKIERPTTALSGLQAHVEAIIDSQYNPTLLSKLPDRIVEAAKRNDIGEDRPNNIRC